MLVVVGGALAVLWGRKQRPGGLLCATTVVLVLFSYGLIYLMKGKSYTQFKWISFFQPLYTAVAFLIVCAAAVTLLERIRVGPQIRVVAGAVAGIALLVVILNNTRELTKPDPHWLHVPPNLAALENNKGLANIHALNVELPPYWDSMWATYFLGSRELYMRSISYYPVTKARATWTLEPTATPDRPTDIVRQLNPDYKIVRKAPAG